MAFSSITVKGLTPDLLILGNYQRFNFADDRIVKFQQFNAYTPVLGLPTENNIELRNSRESGFRLHQLTTSAESHIPGTFKFQSFIADGTGNDIFTYDGDTLSFNVPVNFDIPASISPDYTPPSNSYQSFIFPVSDGSFNLINSFDYTGSAASTRLNFLNYSNYGYRFNHVNTPGNAPYGTIHFQLVDSSEVATEIFFADFTKMTMSKSLSMGNNAITDASNIAIGASVAHGQLQFDNFFNNRKIVFHELNDNDYEFCGLGTSPSYLTYQVESTSYDHVWYAGTSSSSRSELMRVKGSGDVIIPDAGTLYARSSFGSMNITTAANNTMGAAINVKVNGTTGLYPSSKNFTMPANNRLTYTGAQSITATIAASGNFTCSPSGGTSSFLIYKNGVAIASVISMLALAGETTYSLAVPVDLTYGDYLELWCRSSISTTTLVKTMYFNVF